MSVFMYAYMCFFVYVHSCMCVCGYVCLCLHMGEGGAVIKCWVVDVTMGQACTSVGGGPYTLQGWVGLLCGSLSCGHG